jgi:hypothetical protein
MIDIDLGRNKILSLNPQRIVAVADQQLSDGCTVYIDGMDDLNLSCSREEFLEDLKQYYEGRNNNQSYHNGNRDNSNNSIISNEHSKCT